jgi:hypothetical protein
MDDSGINNDHILDLCDFIICKAWEKYVHNENRPTAEDLSIRDLRDLAYTMGAVWGLAQDIIDLDGRLRGMAGPPDMDGPPDSPKFGPYEDEDF